MKLDQKRVAAAGGLVAVAAEALAVAAVVVLAAVVVAAVEEAAIAAAVVVADADTKKLQTQQDAGFLACVFSFCCDGGCPRDRSSLRDEP